MLFPLPTWDCTPLSLSETNFVVIKCLDSMVNYFNWYVLVYCHHNHDIKCILSGKAAKAAMFYITDYTTKMDLKTYEMLSLLLHAVSSVPTDSESPPQECAYSHCCINALPNFWDNNKYMHNRRPDISMALVILSLHMALHWWCQVFYSIFYRVNTNLQFKKISTLMKTLSNHI